MNLGLLEGLL